MGQIIYLGNISMFGSSFLRTPSLLVKMNDKQNLPDLFYEKLGHYFLLQSKILNILIKLLI